MPELDDAIETTSPLRDKNDDIDRDFVARIESTVASGNVELLRSLTADLHEADMGALLEALTPDSRPKLIELLGSDFDFTALTEVDDAIRQEILDELEPRTVADGVKELDSDDAVYILEDLTIDEQTEILEQLPALERISLKRSLDYPEDSAGRRMQTEIIATPPFWTVGQTIDFMRETPDLPETFYEIFVVDPGHHLLGSVPLDRLLRTKRPIKISQIMQDDRHTVLATEEREEVAREFQRYNLVSAPVVDEGGRLVGVVTVDDMVDVIEETVDDDLRALGGVKSDEELSDSVAHTMRSRFTWLFVNLLTALLASSVIEMFEGSVEKMVALAVLMPIVASMGGNAGTQTMTVAVRALATRELSRANTMRIVRREVLVGLLNGLAFAVIMGCIAAVWFRDVNLGYVIAMAFVVVLVAAALGGILIPIALERCGIDPAVASGPFVTTVTDVVGFFAFLGIATLWFGLG